LAADDGDDRQRNDCVMCLDTNLRARCRTAEGTRVLEPEKSLG
jgi:hypothetical protein